MLPITACASAGQFCHDASCTRQLRMRPFSPASSATSASPLRVGAASSEKDAAPVFYALPADFKEPPATTRLLYEFIAADGQRAYSTDRDWTEPGFKRSDQPVCRVWHNPLSSRIHVEK